MAASSRDGTSALQKTSTGQRCYRVLCEPCIVGQVRRATTPPTPAPAWLEKTSPLSPLLPRQELFSQW